MIDDGRNHLWNIDIQTKAIERISEEWGQFVVNDDDFVNLNSPSMIHTSKTYCSYKRTYIKILLANRAASANFESSSYSIFDLEVKII